MNTPYLHRYRNGEYIQYMTDSILLLKKEKTAALSLAPQIEALAASTADIEVIFNRPQYSKLTPKIKAFDTRRELALVGIRRVVRGYKNHFDLTIATAATLLHANIAQHGSNLARLNYREETLIVSHIIQAWETREELAAAVQLLGLESWLAELKESNTQFSKHYLNRVSEKSRKSSSTMAALRKAATQDYRTLVSHIKAYATLDATAVYTNLLQKLYELTSKYNQLVKTRTRPKDTLNPSEVPNDRHSED